MSNLPDTAPKKPTSRTTWLIAVAVLIFGGYLISQRLRTNLPLITVIAVVALVVVFFMIASVVRRRRLSMRTLIIVLPFVVALASLAAREFTNGRKQRETLMRAGVGAQMHSDGIRAAIARSLPRALSNPYYRGIASDIRRLTLHPSNTNCDELRKLSVRRLEEVVIEDHPPGFTSCTIDWLNDLPHSVKLSVLTSSLPVEDSLALNRLVRPLDVLFLQWQSMRPSWKQGEFAAALNVPTRHLGIGTMEIADPSTITTPISPSESLFISGLPTNYSVTLARLKRCSRLELSVDDLSIDACENLCDLPDLRELKLSGPAGINHLRVLLRGSQLHKLELTPNVISEAKFQELQNEKPPGLEFTLLKR